MAKKTKEQPSLRAQWLGRDLRKRRTDLKLKIAEVATYLARDDGTISRYESGDYRIPENDLRNMLDRYDITDPTEFAYFVQLNEEVRQRGWWDGFKKHLGSAFADYVWLESNAVSMSAFCLAVPNGLLQTPEVVHELIGRGPQSGNPEQVKSLVQARTLRAEVLRKRDRHFRFLLHEAALSVQIGDERTMAGQYEHYLTVSELEQVELRVLPAAVNRHIGMGITTGFTNFELADPMPDVTCTETASGAIFKESPDTEVFEQAFDSMWNVDALGPKDSMEYITKLKDVPK
ncbi:helix-turn-helix domain-containing protein [Glycomyces buryatensis]|uniref:helix-turn-helix domain-containing protein n=1 Tax=Glycomyces buryatensis TaxID=2570927 RepID=UPI0014562C1D|nr:helix-turn-helix transcriptional regulator [Glycomyces buryatensis]